MKGLPGINNPDSRGGNKSKNGNKPPKMGYKSNLGAGYNKPGAPSGPLGGVNAFNVPKYGSGGGLGGMGGSGIGGGIGSLGSYGSQIGLGTSNNGIGGDFSLNNNYNGMGMGSS